MKTARKVKAQRTARKVRTHARPVPAPPTALAIVERGGQRELNRDEIDLLKRTVAKGTSDDEFKLFLWVARKHKIDPLTRQLHCVMRFVSRHHQDDKGVWVSGYQMSIQIGIDGYRSLAGRDHPDYGGCDEPEYEFAKPADRQPIKAVIRLWKKGLEHPVVGVAYWDEYAPKDLEKAESFMWRKMPKLMLAKCAEALALRKGYPELADIYCDEEMHQANDDYTPEGRQIVELDARGTTEAAQAVAQRKIEAHKAKQLEASPRHTESATPAKAPTPAQAPAKQQAQPEADSAIVGTVIVKITGNVVTLRPTLTGFRELPEAEAEALKKTLRDSWRKRMDDNGAIFDGESSWTTTPQAMEKLSMELERMGFKLKIEKVEPPKKDDVPKAKLPEATPILGSGIVTKVEIPEKAGKLPAKVWQGNTVLSTFDNKEIQTCDGPRRVFDLLRDAVGQMCHFIVETKGKYHNIVGALKIGNWEWENDGTPIRRREKATQTPSLWKS